MTVVSFLLFQVSVGPCHVVIVAKTNMFASVVMFWLIRNSRFIEPQLLIFWPLSTEYLQQLLPCSSFLPYSYFFLAWESNQGAVNFGLAQTVHLLFSMSIMPSYLIACLNLL